MKTSNQRQWTVMVYMAGDNGAILEGERTNARLMHSLEETGYKDLADMTSVGSTDEVAILVQFDVLSEKEYTYRYIISPAGDESQRYQMPNQNMGDPASLRDFIIWGMKHAPAERVAVILWSHGTGWKEDDIYKYARERQLKLQAEQDEVRFAIGKQKLSLGLFLKSAVRIMQIEDNEIRGICYDDSSMDFLDNADLKQAFDEVEAETGQKVSLIGMDACLMSMLEVAHQLRAHGEVMVSSQEVEPLDGWPYQAILQALAKRPTMSAQELGTLIVQKYAQSFADLRGGARFTQSALDLAKIDRLSKALRKVASELCRALEEEDFDVELALYRITRYVMRFKDKDYVDLHHFLRLLRKQYHGENRALTEALAGVLEMLEREGSPVLANVAEGRDYNHAHGLSIYWPALGCSPFYKGLEFDEVEWGTFIRRLNKVEEENSLPNN